MPTIINNNITKTGLSLGSVLAVLFSVIVNKSVFWAIVHFFCSWFYVIWAFVVHNHQIQSWFERTF